MTDGTTYLGRLHVREARKQLTHDVVFGYFVSTLLAGLGFVKVCMAIGTSDAVWLPVMIAGLAGWLVTLAYPSAWGGPQRMVRLVGGAIGHTLFNILLTLIYFLLFWPLGVLLRLHHGTDPFYRWQAQPPVPMEAWHPKTVTLDEGKTTESDRATPAWMAPFMVLAFFARRGHYIALPVLIIMLALGLILFFLQTSSLAPMIYTLF